jgi:hypothetical protein
MENVQYMRSQDSILGIATGYGLDDQVVGVQAQVGSRIFSSPSHPHQLYVHPTSYPMGTGGSNPGREADHSPPAAFAEVKKMWIYTSKPPHALMA